MIVHRSCKYKLKMTPDLEQTLLMLAGCCRFVWNKALTLNLDRLEKKQPLMWFQELAFWLKFWKSTEDMAFLKKAPSQALQTPSKNLARAFKRKSQRDSLHFRQEFKIGGNCLFLPKIGCVRFFDSRPLAGKDGQLCSSDSGETANPETLAKYEKTLNR